MILPQDGGSTIVLLITTSEPTGSRERCLVLAGSLTASDNMGFLVSRRSSIAFFNPGDCHIGGFFRLGLSSRFGVGRRPLRDKQPGGVPSYHQHRRRPPDMFATYPARCLAGAASASFLPSFFWADAAVFKPLAFKNVGETMSWHESLVARAGAHLPEQRSDESAKSAPTGQAARPSGRVGSATKYSGPGCGVRRLQFGGYRILAGGLVLCRMLTSSWN